MVRSRSSRLPGRPCGPRGQSRPCVATFACFSFFARREHFRCHFLTDLVPVERFGFRVSTRQRERPRQEVVRVPQLLYVLHGCAYLRATRLLATRALRAVESVLAVASVAEVAAQPLTDPLQAFQLVARHSKEVQQPARLNPIRQIVAQWRLLVRPSTNVTLVDNGNLVYYTRVMTEPAIFPLCPECGDEMVLALNEASRKPRVIWVCAACLEDERFNMWEENEAANTAGWPA